MASELHIDVYIDLICPWCMIGKRSLDRALESVRQSHPEVTVCIDWHGVQLLPEVPVEGLPFAEFYEKRLGSKEAVRMRQTQVSEAASRVGLDFNLHRIAVLPNTAKAHRLLTYAATHGNSALYETLLERLFSAYFMLGEDIGDEEMLLKLGQGFGFDRSALESWLAVPKSPVAGDLSQRIHSGVPYYVFNRRYTIAGAQPPEALASIMLTLIKEELAHDTSIPATA